MPVVTFERQDLCRLMGRDVPMEELAARMPLLGGDLDRVEGDQITIEWFPDRPDLLTSEGTARALRAFFGLAPGLREYPVERPTTRLTVDPAVQAVRPHAALCFVRSVPFDAGLVKAVVDAQEKLALTMGRRRRKIAIGVHDAAGLQGPFTYTAVAADSHAFVPLQGDAAMTPAQILERHPKGQEYAHLVPGPTVAMFVDGDGEAISMPPVINARRTTVTSATRDVLLDVTGTDAQAVRRTIALLATSLAERGGTIEAVEVHDATGSWVCPDLRAAERTLHTDDVQRLLGGGLDGDQVAACLARMGHGAEAYDTHVLVRTPAWRFDILHDVDLLEDVAVGHGYDTFPGRLPTRATIAQALPLQDLEDKVRRLLVGHGLSEARTLTLSNAEDQWRHWGDEEGAAVRLRNPVLEEQTLLRVRIAPGLLKVLAANRHRSLPQRLFEVGHVVLQEGEHWPNRLRLGVVESAAHHGFSDIKGLAEGLMRDLGLQATMDAADQAGLVPGRQARILLAGRPVGHLGELHPDTLVAFGLGAATTVLELDLEAVADARQTGSPLPRAPGSPDPGGARGAPP